MYIWFFVWRKFIAFALFMCQQQHLTLNSQSWRNLYDFFLCLERRIFSKYIANKSMPIYGNANTQIDGFMSMCECVCACKARQYIQMTFEESKNWHCINNLMCECVCACGYFIRYVQIYLFVKINILICANVCIFLVLYFIYCIISKQFDCLLWHSKWKFLL